ncbi:hypothetical protein BGX24_001077 [Mortierella sp. AD032]|nr:hypothetical protein BGX24_001077 [Mortierella sp. AD032]
MSTSLPLPAECFLLILQVFKSRQDTTTLATLLRVNKSICQDVLPVLYADPYHLKNCRRSGTHRQDNINDLIKLTRLLLRQNNRGGFTVPSNSPPSNQLIIYCPKIVKLDLEHVPGSFDTIFKNKTIQGNNTLRTFLDQPTYSGKPEGFLEDQLLRDLTWALCDPNNLQELALPLTEVERYLDLVNRFSRLTSVVFVNDIRLTVASSEPDAERPKLFDGMVQFVERHATLFTSKMRQARCTLASDTRNDCPEEIHSKLALLLPPLPAPSFLDYTNWTQFVLRSKDINLGHVKRILGDGYPEYKKVQFMDQLFTNDGQFLHRCRSLETLDLDVRAQEALGMFRWAAEEQDNRELDLAYGRTSERVPLREVSLSITNPTQHHILRDIARAFGDTLTKLDFSGYRLQGHMGSQALFVDVSERRLDRLTQLSAGTSDGTLLLHPYLLWDCPSLKTLSLNDNYAQPSMQAHPTFRYCEPAVLEHVTTIELFGTPAATFHPDRLHFTKNLESLQLAPWDTSMLGRRVNDFDDPEDEEEDVNEGVNEGAQSDWQRHQAEDEGRMALWPRLSKPVWTWNWNLPKLTDLSLSFEYAHNLRFRMFHGTPNLTRLQLDGASNIHALGPLIHPSEFSSPLSVLAHYLSHGNDNEDDDDSGRGNGDDNEGDWGECGDDNDVTDDVGALGTTIPGIVVLPKLEDFQVNGNWQMDRAMMRYLFTQIAPNIELLCMHGPFGFTAKELVKTTSQHLTRLRQVDTHMGISDRDARSAGLKRNDGSAFSDDYVLINPPEGYDPCYVSSSSYF